MQLIVNAARWPVLVSHFLFMCIYVWICCDCLRKKKTIIWGELQFGSMTISWMNKTGNALLLLPNNCSLDPFIYLMSNMVINMSQVTWFGVISLATAYQIVNKMESDKEVVKFYFSPSLLFCIFWYWCCLFQQKRDPISHHSQWNHKNAGLLINNTNSSAIAVWM